MSEHFCRWKRGQAEARQQKGMPREHVQRAQDFRGQIRPMSDKRLHESAPAFAVWSENGFGVAQIALKRYGRAVVERMGEWSGRVNPLQTVSLQRERRKKRGARGEWMHGGAEIVEEAWHREFERARGAARLRLRFEDVNAHAALREGDGSGEAVGSGANDAGPARALSGCGHWRGGGSGGHSTAMMRPF